MNRQDTAGDTEPVDQTELLLTFLNERDAVCPRCDYNLRNLTRSICPECGVELILAVSAPELPHALFLLTVAPGFFSGIALVLIAMIIGWEMLSGSGPALANFPWEALVCLGFGLLSGMGAVLLCLFRKRFISQPCSRQIFWALTMWATHFAVLYIVGPF